MRTLIATLVVAAGACGAWGQGEPPLGGPEVRERRPPGAEQPFGEPGTRARRAQALPHRAFMEAIRPLRRGADSDAPAQLRLTEEQDKEIAALDAEYTATMRRSMAQAREEMEEMGVEVDRPRRGEGRGVPEGRPPADRLSPDQRARAEALMRNAPRAADWQTKMFAVLSEPQQDFVRARLEQTRRRVEERRGQQEMERRLRDRPAGPQGAPAAAPAAPGRERLRRIAELMSRLPEGEREQLLTRIERELERRVGDRPDGQEADPAPPPPPKGEPDAAPPARRRARRSERPPV